MEKKLKYSTVIFDLDGTLLDTIEDLGEAVGYALSKRGLPGHGMDQYRKMVGNGIRNLVKRALPENLREDEKYLDAALADFREYYCAHIDVHTRPYDGIPELLSSLQDRGVRLAVASNKFQSGAEHLAREFFPDIDFVAILGNAPSLPLKPSPEVVERILSLTGSPKGETAFVGDSGVDMRTALNAGVHPVAVLWGFRGVEEFGDAEKKASNPGELKAILIGER